MKNFWNKLRKTVVKGLKCLCNKLGNFLVKISNKGEAKKICYEKEEIEKLINWWTKNYYYSFDDVIDVVTGESPVTLRNVNLQLEENQASVDIVGKEKTWQISFISDNVYAKTSSVFQNVKEEVWKYECFLELTEREFLYNNGARMVISKPDEIKCIKDEITIEFNNSIASKLIEDLKDKYFHNYYIIVLQQLHSLCEQIDFRVIQLNELKELFIKILAVDSSTSKFSSRITISKVNSDENLEYSEAVEFIKNRCVRYVMGVMDKKNNVIVDKIVINSSNDWEYKKESMHLICKNGKIESKGIMNYEEVEAFSKRFEEIKIQIQNIQEEFFMPVEQQE